MSMRYRLIESPPGPFALIRDQGGQLRTAWVSGEDDPLLAAGVHDRSLLSDLADDLGDYFLGGRPDFRKVPTPGPAGFYSRCWEACRNVDHGSTISYVELARRAGSSPGAARAAGQAMRNNPLPVVIPCHRVVAASGRIGGFSGSDDPDSPQIRCKRWLLDLESAPLPADPPSLWSRE